MSRTAWTRAGSLVRSLTISRTESSDRIRGATLAIAARQLKSVLSSLSTQRPAKLAEPSGAKTPAWTGLGTTARLYAYGLTLIAWRSSSGDLSEVTISTPPGTTSLLIGCTPYHAQDSMPLHMVSSTTIDISTDSGSKRARLDSSSTSSVETTAKFLAGTPFRSGESP